MKNLIRYIIAIPIGIIASVLLPKWFEIIFDTFLPFDFINNFIDNYFLKFIAGFVATGITLLIVPNKKILFGVIVVVLNIASSIHLYCKGGGFNYLFLIGSIVPLAFYYNNTINEKD